MFPRKDGEPREKRALEQSFREIRETRVLTPQNIDTLEAYFPGKILPALECVAALRVQKLTTTAGRDFWTVAGKSGTYLVLPDFFCTCMDFHMSNVISTREGPLCYHVLARKLGALTGRFTEKDCTEREFRRFMKVPIGFL